METNPRPLVLFHDQCMDGLIAAWTAWRRFRAEADYRAVRYGTEPPDCTDRLVYVLDFCYPPDVTARMADQATRVVILDHHKTAIEAFAASWAPRGDVLTHFDITRSGATMALQLFDWDVKTAGRPWIAEYAEDRDLWRWALPRSKEVNAYLASLCLGLPHEEAFHNLDGLHTVLGLNAAISLGKGAQSQLDCYVRQMVGEARPVTFAGHANIPMVNLPKPMDSDVLNELAKTALFAVGWRQVGSQVTFSLRSKAFDVSGIARSFGGGGHALAAGFPMKSPVTWEQLLKEDPEDGTPELPE